MMRMAAVLNGALSLGTGFIFEVRFCGFVSRI